MSHEAPCVPPRNLRQFVEVLLDRDDKQTATEILNNYSGCLGAKEAEPRRANRDWLEPTGRPLRAAGRSTPWARRSTS